MKARILAMMTLVSLVFGSVAVADLSSEAEAHVWVDVVANIAVGVISANVDIGEVQTGEFTGEVIFRVDANLEEIDMYVVATDLYKGDSPDAEAIIPVCGGGAQVTPENGTEKEGGDGLLEWATAAMLNGLNGQESESGTFESGQRGHFSQSVAVEITYDQKDPELPTGEYSGFVKLVGMVIP